MGSNTNKYDNDIQVLSGNEAVRKRPRMYFGEAYKTDAHILTKLIVETLCLSRAFASCDGVKTINVCVRPDNQVKVWDDGKGLGTDGVKTIGTKLNGGKKTLFDRLLTELAACKKDKHESIRSFCDLGIMPVNAVSEYFIGRSKVDDTKTQVLHYELGNKIGETYEGGSDFGLMFEFKFDPIIFGELKIDRDDLINTIDEIRKNTSASIELKFEDN